MSFMPTLPADWRVRRLKYVATCNDDVLPESTDEFEELRYVEISGVSLVGGIESTTDVYFHAAPSRARRRVNSGDILVSTVRTYLKAIAAVPHAEPNLIASTGFCVVRPGSGVDSGYLGWVAKSEPFVAAIVARSAGVSYPAIKPSELTTLNVPLPPLETQRRVAHFLDVKTARIDALIAKKRALLERLAEQRQSLITQAVTKGLDPGVPMKDSGIDWLGQIPAHWDVKRLRHLADVILGLTYAPGDVVDGTEGVLVIRASNVQGGQLVHADDVYVSREVPSALMCMPGDVVVCSRNGSRHLIGKCATVTNEWAGTTFGAFMTVIRSDYSTWLSWVLASQLFTFQSGRYMSSTINQLTTSTLKSLELPIPTKDEQARISAMLTEGCRSIENAITQTNHSLDLLTEYRAAIITAAVTGQLEVPADGQQDRSDEHLGKLAAEVA